MKKKLLAMLLSVTMVVTLTPAISFADSEIATAGTQSTSEAVADITIEGVSNQTKEEQPEAAQVVETEKAKSAIKPMAEDESITVIESGLCGDTVTYELTSDGLLTISGSGNMTNYVYAKWASNRVVLCQVNGQEF